MVASRMSWKIQVMNPPARRNATAPPPTVNTAIDVRLVLRQRVEKGDAQIDKQCFHGRDRSIRDDVQLGCNLKPFGLDGRCVHLITTRLFHETSDG